MAIARGSRNWSRISSSSSAPGFNTSEFSAISQKWRTQFAWKSSKRKSSPKCDRNKVLHCDLGTPIDSAESNLLWQDPKTRSAPGFSSAPTAPGDLAEISGLSCREPGRAVPQVCDAAHTSIGITELFVGLRVESRPALAREARIVMDALKTREWHSLPPGSGECRSPCRAGSDFK